MNQGKSERYLQMVEVLFVCDVFFKLIFFNDLVSAILTEMNIIPYVEEVLSQLQVRRGAVSRGEQVGVAVVAVWEGPVEAVVSIGGAGEGCCEGRVRSRLL